MASVRLDAHVLVFEPRIEFVCMIRGDVEDVRFLTNTDRNRRTATSEWANISRLDAVKEIPLIIVRRSG